MDAFGTTTLDGMALSGQDPLMGSVWDSATALDNNAGLTGVFNAMQSTASRGAFTPKLEEPLPTVADQSEPDFATKLFSRSTPANESNNSLLTQDSLTGMAERAAIASTASAVEDFVSRVISTAEREWNEFGQSTLEEVGLEETEEGAWQQIALDYWQTGGIGRTDIDTPEEVGDDINNPWSAAFVSWVMQEAGAGDRFEYDASHSYYIEDAVQNRQENDPNAAFFSYTLDEFSPEPGDLIGYAREEGVDISTPPPYDSHVDIVVAKREGEIDVIGGNVSDSVTKKTLAINAEGRLIDTSEDWFVILENRNPSIAPPPDSPLLEDGDIIALENLGVNANPNFKFLDGRTSDGTVGLAPSTDDPFTGTQWEVDEVSEGVVTLENLGVNANPNFKFLDGRTSDGTVGLAPSTDGPFTGTQWEVNEVSEGVVTLENLGVNANPNFKFLDGRTSDGTVGLAPSTDGPFTGTQWRVVEQEPEAEVLWGVDSVDTVTSLLDGVKSTYGEPDFFGRYLGGDYAMTPEEVAFAHENDIQILVVDQDFGDQTTDVLTGYENGVAAGQNAISNAETLGVPDGVAILADIESGTNEDTGEERIVDSGWLEGWFDTLVSGGYRTGYYSNPLYENVENPELDFESAYAQAVTNNPVLGTDAIIWSNQDSVGRTTKEEAPAYAPLGPTSNPNAPVLAWQYGIPDPNDSFPEDPNVDTDLALSTFPFWESDGNA